MDKGIINGIDYEQSSRALPFSLFKIQTSTHLFLPQFMRYHLESPSSSLHHALAFAENYKSIVYFSHALEVLLHSVLEDADAEGSATSADADAAANTSNPSSISNPTLHSSEHVTLNSPIAAASLTDTPPRSTERFENPRHDSLSKTVEFLDHFPESLDVVVGCARKTEMERWGVLFAAVGQPRELYEACVRLGKWRTAAGYLLVLHNLEELDDVKVCCVCWTCNMAL
jgi:hypothetical protein